MDRPDFQRMLADCKQGKIDIVVTKDMSRLTRNSTHSGQLRDEFFPKHHIRYIGVTDGVDTGKDDDLIVFRSVFNEIYSKDIGKEEWIQVENVHEPLVDMDTCNLVQEKVKMRKRPDAWGNYGIFAGLVKCGECGSTMNQRVANAKAKTRGPVRRCHYSHLPPGFPPWRPPGADTSMGGLYLRGTGKIPAC